LLDKKDGVIFYKIDDKYEKLIGFGTSFKYEEAELACLNKLIEIAKL
jgi:hypothetical protein